MSIWPSWKYRETKIQNIYEKEKQELLFKIQSLQSHCERLKNSLTEQVN